MIKKQHNLFAMIDPQTETQYYMRVSRTPFKLYEWHAAIMRLVVSDEKFCEKIIQECIKDARTKE